MFVQWFRDSKNPFVEQAVQYCVAAAHAKLDKDKKDILEKRLLQGELIDFRILSLVAQRMIWAFLNVIS